MIKIKTPSYLVGWIVRNQNMVDTDGHVLVIGGTARMMANLVIGGQFAEERSADLDLSVVGGTYFHKVDTDVDVEYDACCHACIEDLLDSRDLTINQVAIDSEYIYVTKKFLQDSMQGRVRPVGCIKDLWENWDTGEFQISHRLYFRMARFVATYGGELCSFWNSVGGWNYFNFALQGWKAMKKGHEVFFKYLEILGKDVEDYFLALDMSCLEEEEEIREELEELL